MGQIIHGKYQSKEDCAKTVKNLKPFANGMTWDSTNFNCYAETGEAQINSDFRFLITCQL